MKCLLIPPEVRKDFMKYAFLIITSLLFSACASNTGVVPLSENSYKIYKRGATGFSGSDAVRSDVMLQASDHCAKSGRTVFVTNEILGSPPYIFGNFPKAEIQFKCLSDAELISARRDGADTSAKSEKRNSNSRDDVYSELKNLKQLLSEGIITQAEFDARKKKILDR